MRNTLTKTLATLLFPILIIVPVNMFKGEIVCHKYKDLNQNQLGNSIRIPQKDVYPLLTTDPGFTNNINFRHKIA